MNILFSTGRKLLARVLPARRGPVFAQAPSEQPSSGPAPHTIPLGPVRVFGLNKTQAEDLLDWLESTGQPRAEVSGGDPEFVVRYRQDSSHR